MVAPDDKQNRLSTLSQDVIAVSKKPATAAPAAKRAPEKPPERPVERPVERPERKEIPPSQDVFKVSAPAQPAIPRPAPKSAKRAPLHAARDIPVATLATAALAGLALLVAIYAATSGGGAGDTAAIAGKTEQLEVELKMANERVAKLEAKLGAASADAEKLGAPGQVNVLQLSAGIRDLRNDLDMVANELAGITTQVGELRTLAGSSSKDAKMALAQIEQVGSRVATINQQIAGAPRASSGGGSGDVQTQLKSLAQKTDKMAADIRQLYRQVGSQ